jgi:XTP/dITP diphosphohydrolase
MPSKLKNEILLATNNAGKLFELRQLLAGLPDIALHSPANLGLDLDPEETGTTYTENAALKAQAFVRASGLVTLADDSGLEVAALDGAPGLHSKRYTGTAGASDTDRRHALIANLAGAPRPWSARFVAVVALAVPGEELRFFRGECRGEIIPEERGSNGFGYDPIFWFPERGHTMAELTDDEKNAVSHRGNAVRAALPDLHAIFDPPGGAR